jgi:hypothetical protein
METMQHELAATVSEIWQLVAASARGDVNEAGPLHARLARLTDTVEATFRCAIHQSSPLTHQCQGTCDEFRVVVNSTADALTGVLRDIRNMSSAARSGALQVPSCERVSSMLDQLSELVDQAFQDTVEFAEALERRCHGSQFHRPAVSGCAPHSRAAWC